MKRITLAATMLAVALVSMTAYFVRVGLDLHRHGFTSAEIAITIGATLALDAIAGCLVVALVRRGRAADGRRR